MNKARLQFHIENDEVFAQLATWADLQSQEIARRLGNGQKSLVSLDKLRDTLMYLHRTYHVIPRKPTQKQKTSPLEKGLVTHLNEI
jgi:hypothetical protein